ncbi:GPI ethanolamine phosphate transferase 1-like [Cimex lectularius]|uniref:GPI ethanolamine phosphate transferase 1 n=1 Tax=Cimex lectularius TaxID=79782 RepID=A0A8I6RFH3_CIMLE|nr:GPI ethanolamine phosphate transferase 1-like [Cimex lectularius]
MIWIWCPVCVVTALILALGCYEIVLGPGHHVQVSQNGENAHENGTSSDRLFLFLVDGLRNSSGLSTSNVTSRGVFGLRMSYTRMAIVGAATGRYDPVTSFLFSTPINADHVFAKADRVYYFGPEATPRYFGNPDNWLTDVYPTQWLNDYPENKGLIDKPDQYVLDKVLKHLKENKGKFNKKQKCIYFIHLVTMDLAARAEGVKSPRAADAMLSVETSISKIEAYAEDVFGPSQTAYVILSGHGTDEYGRSGGSTLDELHLPVFIWGNGTRPGVIHSGVRPVTDLCPLLAALLGVPVPVHSRGKIPRVFVAPKVLPYALAANALQLGVLCRSMARSAGPLSRKLVSIPLTPCLYSDYTFNISVHLEKKNFEAVFKESTNLIEIAHSCINKMEGFYSGSLLFTLVMAYLAWIGLLCSTLATPPPPVRFAWSWIPMIITLMTHVLFFFKIVVVALVIWTEAWPWYLLPVFELPVFLWWTAVSRSERIWLSFYKEGIVKSAMYVAFAVLVVEVIHWTHSKIYFSMLFFLPYVTWTSTMNSRYVPTHVTCVWVGTTLIILIVPSLLWQMKELGKSSPAILNVGAAIWIIGGCLSAYRMDLRAKEHIVTGVVAGAGTLAIWFVDLYHLGIWENWMRAISWIILSSPAVTVFGSSTLSTRLIQVCMALSVPLLLVSSGQEPLSFLILSINLYAWLRLEASSPQYKHQNYLRALALHFYLNYAISVIGPQPIVFTYAHKVSHFFSSVESPWINFSMNWYKLGLIASLVISFWSAVSLYIGAKTSLTFKSWLVLAAISSARHCLSLFLNDEPNLSDLFYAHFIFLAVLIPFCIIPFVLLVTKYRNIIRSD